MRNQTDQITWRDGQVPVSSRFDDPFFSLENGLAETRHVFLEGNGLPALLRPGFHIAELGFGTGLNLLATWQATVQAGQTETISYTSFEAFPMARADMARALEAFPALGSYRTALLEVWDPAGGTFRLGPLEVRVIIGDARQTLPQWEGTADAWFLDGFSPAKNPELWEPGLLKAVAAHTAPGGTCASYTAAGFVRRGLEDAGFTVTRAPGYGRKRHMTRGLRA